MRRAGRRRLKASRLWKDLTDDQLVNHWSGASRQSRNTNTPEYIAAAQRKIAELHEEAAHHGKTLRALSNRKQQREDRGRKGARASIPCGQFLSPGSTDS